MQVLLSWDDNTISVSYTHLDVYKRQSLTIRIMMIEVLKSKLHCVRVTEANLNYMGSITIDEDLAVCIE